MVIHDHDDISPLIINQTRDGDPRPLVVPSVLETLETRLPQSNSSDKLYRGVKNIFILQMFKGCSKIHTAFCYILKAHWSANTIYIG